MNTLHWCCHWRVLAGILVAGIGVPLLVAPHAILSVLPVLLVAACPLSMAAMMLFMGKAPGTMGSQGRQQGQQIMGRDTPLQQSILTGVAATESGLRYCTECGAPVYSAHPVPRFCSQCGADLRQASPAVRDDVGVAR